MADENTEEMVVRKLIDTQIVMLNSLIENHINSPLMDQMVSNICGSYLKLGRVDLFGGFVRGICVWYFFKNI